jgi:hypothetical protein
MSVTNDSRAFLFSRRVVDFEYGDRVDSSPVKDSEYKEKRSPIERKLKRRTIEESLMLKLLFLLLFDVSLGLSFAYTA